MSIRSRSSFALAVWLYTASPAWALPRLYVFAAPGNANLSDSGEDRSDSVKDLKGSLGKSKVLTLTEGLADADVALEILDRSMTERGLVVRARLLAGEQAIPLEGVCPGDCLRWRSAAGNLGDRVEAWMTSTGANAPDLLTKGPALLRIQARLPSGPVVTMSADNLKAALAFGSVAGVDDFRSYRGRSRFRTTKELDQKARKSLPIEDFLFSPIVLISTPFSRVTSFCIEARRQYKTPSGADVPDSLREPVVLVEAEAFIKGGRMADPVVNVEHVVIGREGDPGAAGAMQPLKVERKPKVWTNAMGVSREGSGVSAWFPAEAFRPGYELRIITSDGRESVVAFPTEWLAKLR